MARMLAYRSRIAAAAFALAMPMTPALAASPIGQWTPGFAGPDNPDFMVKSLHVHDDGRGPALYAGGIFESAGGIPAPRVARWDGVTWEALAGGLSGVGDPLLGPAARAMATYDDGGGPALFVGGEFTLAGGVPVSNIARWDGETWTDVGGGINGEVYALCVFDDGDGPELYATGQFTMAGGVAAENIARWNGVEWSSVGSGIDMPIATDVVLPVGSSLATFSGPLQNSLYVGGNFTRAGGLKVGGIARWQGGVWHQVDQGVEGWVLSLQVFNDGFGGVDLYLGGFFSKPGTVTLMSIGRWDGATISRLDNFAGTGINGPVCALASFGNGVNERLFVGGAFDFMLFNNEIFTPQNIFAWRRTTIYQLGVGIPVALPSPTFYEDPDFAAVQALCQAELPNGGALYAGGWFNSAGSALARNLARWDGSAWRTVEAKGLNGPVNALAMIDGDVIAAGEFLTAAGSPATRVARWNGSSWTPYGIGLNAAGRAILPTPQDPDGFILAGDFTNAAGVNASRIAAWDGAAFSPLGAGFSAPVRALAWHEGELFAGGDFTLSGPDTVLRIARWDGAAWRPLDTGLVGVAHALASFDDGDGAALFVGGQFSQAGPVPTSNLAMWRNDAWSAGPGQPNAIVRALLPWTGPGPDGLVVAGDFTSIDGSPFSRIALWDGEEWSSLGEGFNGPVRALSTARIEGRTVLIAAGDFTASGAVQTGRTAVWDGQEWSPLTGSGANASVRAVIGSTVDDAPVVHIGGEFASVSNLSAGRFAEWRGDAFFECIGDIDGDGLIGFSDLMRIVSAFNAAEGEPAYDAAADLDENGQVDFSDLNIVLSAYNTACGG